MARVSRQWELVDRRALIPNPKLSRNPWLVHAKVRATRLKARVGPQGTMAWALQELRLHRGQNGKECPGPFSTDW